MWVSPYILYVMTFLHTINVLEELRLIKELRCELLQVRPTVENIVPCTGNGEELSISKVKPERGTINSH